LRLVPPIASQATQQGQGKHNSGSLPSVYSIYFFVFEHTVVAFSAFDFFIHLVVQNAIDEVLGVHEDFVVGQLVEVSTCYCIVRHVVFFFLFLMTSPH
jgi:hypothetical protein